MDGDSLVSFRIYRNLGDFTFSLNEINFNQGLEYCSVVFGDYDDDGDLDIAAAGFYSFIIYNNIESISNSSPSVPL